MKKLFLIPMFMVSAIAINAQTTTTTTGAPTSSQVENKNGPVMTFDVLEYNFGTIKQGEVVTHEFKFKNTGKEPLIINNAVGSCGCTVPDYPKEPIKPNGEGVIKVTFNSAGKLNIQDKTVTITYDTDKQVILHLKGTVEAPAPAAPAQGSGTATPAPAPAQGTGTTTTAPAKAPASQPKQPKTATAAPANKPADPKSGN